MNRPGAVATAAFVLATFAIAAFALGHRTDEGESAVTSWELRVCADPDALPFSSREETGFENRIARIVADELGATLTYDWFPQGPEMVTRRLRAGHCDLIVGVPDGSEDLLTTISYYRSPYMFVYRRESGFELDSFDDPVLADLEIAVQNVTVPPHAALLARGLGGNVVSDFLQGEPHLGIGRARAVVDAVVNGEVDVALVWGPVAGYLAQRSPADLVLRPVQPQLEPPFTTQTFPMTMAVRLGDDAFRDLLDGAIAERWEEIRAVLLAYGVPLQETARPMPGVEQADALKIALLTPTITGGSAIAESLYDIAGEAARRGALLAESDLDEGPAFELLIASVPTAAAAERAAERLAHNHQVAAFLGGLGAGQAEAVAEVARRAGKPFFDIGSPFMAREGSPGVFHVEASSAMYLGAIAAWQGMLGHDRFFIVHQQGEPWSRMAVGARSALAETISGARVVGVAEVSRGQPSYQSQLEEVGRSRADALILLLDPRDQLAFMAQLSSSRYRVPAMGFPAPVTQTRDFLATAAYRAGEGASGPHLLLWEPTLDEGEAERLNLAFASRFGEPMDPSAWAAYQAIAIYLQAAAATGSSDPSAILDYLTSPDTVFPSAKGELRFDETGQLLQPLYVVEVDPLARWGNRLSQKLAVATPVGRVEGESASKATGVSPGGGR